MPASNAPESQSVVALRTIMKISADHLKRYKQIAQLMWKYGRSDLAAQMIAAHGVTVEPNEPGTSSDTLPQQFADDLEAMGPTYVKLGQVLASRPDLMPDPYIKS